MELNNNPEVAQKFPKLPLKSPKPPRKFLDFPGGQPISLGSLTPSPDSQKLSLKNLLPPFRSGECQEPLNAPFLKGCFPVDFQEVKRPLGTKSVKRPIKVGKRPINEGKRPIEAKVPVGVSVGSLMGCFRAPPPWRKTAPLKRPIKRSMRMSGETRWFREWFAIQSLRSSQWLFTLWCVETPRCCVVPVNRGQKRAQTLGGPS